MEAETQTEEEQVNIIEPSDPITPMDSLSASIIGLKRT
jgi:hypothetical protein